MHVTDQAVGKWRRRLIARRFDGWRDEPRPDTPHRRGDRMIDSVISKALGTTPEDATNWSLRSMAQSTGIGPTSVHRIGCTFALQPDRTGTFKLQTHPLFVQNVREIVSRHPRHRPRPSSSAWTRSPSPGP